MLLTAADGYNSDEMFGPFDPFTWLIFLVAILFGIALDDSRPRNR